MRLASPRAFNWTGGFRFWQERPGHDRNVVSAAAIKNCMSRLSARPTPRGISVGYPVALVFVVKTFDELRRAYVAQLPLPRIAADQFVVNGSQYGRLIQAPTGTD